MNFEDVISCKAIQRFIHHHSLLNLLLGFKVLPPQVISKYTRMCIIIGVCENTCHTVQESLQFITQSFNSYPIPCCNSQSVIGQGHNIHHAWQ